VGISRKRSGIAGGLSMPWHRRSASQRIACQSLFTGGARTRLIAGMGPCQTSPNISGGLTKPWRSWLSGGKSPFGA
jgi:hypothetical protein